MARRGDRQAKLARALKVPDLKSQWPLQEGG